MHTSNPAALEDPVFDLYSTAIDANPFPYYAELRDSYPCYWSDRNGTWILSRYDDIARAAQDWQTFSSIKGNMVDELPGRAGATLGTTDPPRHDRLRALTQAAFGKKSVECLTEPTRESASKALERLHDVGQFDFVADFSSRVTVEIVFRMLGLPPRDPTEIRRKVILSVSTDKAARGRTDLHIAAFKELSDFIAEQVAERRAQPKDDLITALAEAEIDGDKLSEREVVLTTATFVMAGVESLSSFMSLFALNLCDFPEQRRKLLANPALLAPAIEESLRYNTSAQRFKRVLTRAVELHGQQMPEGAKVTLAYGSANRDPRKFPNPDVYDIERNPRTHLGFGAGPHFCLGTNMARLVTAVAMRTFLESFPHYERTDSTLEWVPSSNFRSPAALPLRAFGPRAPDRAL
jgi:cytochrome P450